MLRENDAARILCGMCADEHADPSAIKEGKIVGLLRIDRQDLRAVHSPGGDDDRLPPRGLPRTSERQDRRHAGQPPW